ncbi:SPJ_0845 family protein [Vagococcus sp.]|uniref:SPJ_0845 family protein n=1 Tax=Vagococcus sp. TaxID=1933889 RepID=UPI003F948753
MGLTYRKKDKLEKLFEEFAIEPDKKETVKVEKKASQSEKVSFKVNVTSHDNNNEN